MSVARGASEGQQGVGAGHPGGSACGPMSAVATAAARATTGACVTGAIGDQFERWFEDARETAPAGLVILTAAGAVAVGNAAALDLLGCTSTDELRPLLQPVLKRLESTPSDSSPPGAQRFDMQVPVRSQTRRIVGSARRLEHEQLRWLLLLRSEEQARAFDATLQHAASNQLLQRLHGTLRHDLNSPIQAALWTFDLLQRAVGLLQVDPAQRAPVEETTARGRKELARLKEAMRRLLSFVTPSPDERERVDVRDLAGDAQRLIATEASLFEVKMGLELPSQPLVVEGVRGQLEQALVTLMLNAVDAIADGGSVTTAVRELEGLAEIVVRGSPTADGTMAGRGVSAHARLGTRHATVGLHAARSIAAAHGGDLSEPPSAGPLTFRLRLPLARPQNRSV